MSFSVNTNAGALSALGNLSSGTRMLDVTQTRINTGLKVSSVKDDAAAYSIAQRMRGDIAGLSAVNNSLERAQSELDVAIAGAEAISDLLIEMKELAVAAKDAGLDSDSRTSLNNSYQQHLAQIDSISSNASFNGTNLLNGDTLSAITDVTGSTAISTSGNEVTGTSLGLEATDISSLGGSTANTLVSGPINFNSGDLIHAVNSYMETNHNSVYSDPAQYNQATAGFVAPSIDPYFDVAVNIQAAFSSITSMNTTSVGGETVLRMSGGNIYIEGSGVGAEFTESATSSAGGAPEAVDLIETAISSVNNTLSNLGSTANRLALQQSFSGQLSDSLETGVGNIVDADLAKEAATLQSLQTKQQLSLQALSIANQAPQTLLSLFN